MNSIINRRDISIDIIKFLAVFLIINSHADECYPQYSVLATGGAIGDALFLFCSGYTLFHSGIKRFDNWYKRRINRIYPSVVTCLIVELWFGHIIIGELSLVKILGGEFVVAIMIYYILLYIIRRFFVHRVFWVFAIVIMMTLIAYWFFPYKYETSSKGIYGITTIFRWIPFFSMMLMGAWIGMKVRNADMRITAKWSDYVAMIICMFVFYGIQFMAKKIPTVAPWQIVTLPFLAGIVYYFWRCCNAGFFIYIYNTNVGNWIIMSVGGLCLESYLIQFSLFTDKLNWLFPFNIPLIMLAILVVSYICRCLARIIIQTFCAEDYKWRKVFEIR